MKLYNKKNKQSHKIKATSKLLTTVTENQKKSKKTIHHKLKEYTMQRNTIQKISENYSIFSLSKLLTQSPSILTNSLAYTHKPENKSGFCH